MVNNKYNLLKNILNINVLTNIRKNELEGGKDWLKQQQQQQNKKTRQYHSK